MSEHHASNAPFKTLGSHLKYLRENSNESLAEVSGAVEIDEKQLSSIEEGRMRPEEDILLLLITHFGMSDHEAVQLWELAGYEGSPEAAKHGDTNLKDDVQKAVVMMIALDARTLYSDGISVQVTNAGITLSFTQENGQKDPATISKVGMSYEQAVRVADELNYALLKAKYLKSPRQLPPNISPEAS